MDKLEPALVLGIGNILMGDDGLGVRFAMAFERDYLLPPGVTVFDGGTGGLALLELIQGFASIIVIDAVNATGAPAGTILLFKDEELSEAKLPARPTAHQIGLVELLKTARFTGYAPSVRLIGVVPEQICAKTVLSGTIKNLTRQVTTIIADELNRLGIECKRKAAVKCMRYH